MFPNYNTSSSGCSRGYNEIFLRRNGNVQLLTHQITVLLLSLLNLFLCNCDCIITKFIIAYCIEYFIC